MTEDSFRLYLLSLTTAYTMHIHCAVASEPTNESVTAEATPRFF